MKNIILILVVLTFLFGCGSRNNFNNMDKNIPEPPKNGYFLPELSEFICITGRIIISYSDETGVVSEGVYDNLAQGFKWYDSKYYKLNSTSKEVISGKVIYTMKYIKSDFIHMTQRVTYGEGKHNNWTELDYDYINRGYERMIGEVLFRGDRRESVCWGKSL